MQVLARKVISKDGVDLTLFSDDPEYFPPEEEEFDVKQLSNINMIVANCSSPANYFHLLRRQIALPFRFVTILCVCCLS